MFCILLYSSPFCVVNCYSLNCLMIVNGHQPFSFRLIPVMMIHRNWFRQDNFRFHKLSFCHELSFGQFQIGICLVNSQVKRNGNESFQVSDISEFLFSFPNTIVMSRFSLPFAPICTSVLFQLNLNLIEFELHSVKFRFNVLELNLGISIQDKFNLFQVASNVIHFFH
jgi:hypothetical protein